MTEPYELPQRPKTDAWIDRVRAADAAAEHAYNLVLLQDENNEQIAAALIAIAAELRAARIARRPGAGH